MPQDDLTPTSKADRLSPDELSAEARWAELMKPSRQRNLTPSQRRSLAIVLWGLRRERLRKMRDGSWYSSDPTDDPYIAYW